MAELTVDTAITPYAGKYYNTGCVLRYFRGPGVTISELAPAVAERRNTIVAGRVTFEGAGGLDITSASTVLDGLEFVTRGTMSLPVGFETVTNEALKIINADGVTLRGWIIFKAVKKGENVPD